MNVIDDSKFFFTTYHGGTVNIALHTISLPILTRGLLTRNTALVLATFTLAELSHAYHYYFVVHRNPLYGTRMLPYQLGYTAIVMPILLKLFRWY